MLKSAAMKPLALAPLLAVLAACGHTYDGGVEDPEPFVFDREESVLEVDVPDSEELQYMALCVFEGRALTAWLVSRGDAISEAYDHSSRGHSHTSTVVWRQRPMAAYRTVPFPGPSDSAPQ